MVHFRVPIRAVPQGSHHAFIVKTKTGMNRAVITDNNSQSIHGERVAIAEEYQRAGGINYGDKAVRISVVFSFVRPKSVKEKKRPYMTIKPDVDKLLRGLLDSLSGHAFRDDCQVVELNSKKIYSEEEYIDIDIEEYTEGTPQQMTL